MRKIAAFFTALILFFFSTIIIHFVIASNLRTDSRGFGTWINAYKDLSYSAIYQNLNDDTYMMMGSSEFQHGRNTKYHPTEIFRGMNMDVMCVGAAYNQCLSHAITIGAVGNDLETKKVVLILSPSWFEDKGVRKNAFAVRFSETQYMAMLRNPNLSKGLKERIAQRVEPLLEKAPAMQNNVERYNNAFLNNKINPMYKMYFYIRKSVSNEKEAVNINTVWKTTGKEAYDKFKRDKMITGKVPNWEKLKEDADREFEKESTNSFHMKDKLFERKFRPVLNKQKNTMLKRRFRKTSPEYGDLKLFLDVCKEERLNVCLILLPINGYWYDYTGFKKEHRDVLPEQIMEVVRKYDNVEFTSFYDRGYDVGFLEDAFHPAGRGWIEINERAYEFFTEDKKPGKENNQ